MAFVYPNRPGLSIFRPFSGRFFNGLEKSRIFDFAWRIRRFGARGLSKTAGAEGKPLPAPAFRNILFRGSSLLKDFLFSSIRHY
jgi:hypothetical protein